MIYDEITDSKPSKPTEYLFVSMNQIACSNAFKEWQTKTNGLLSPIVGSSASSNHILYHNGTHLYFKPFNVIKDKVMADGFFRGKGNVFVDDIDMLDFGELEDMLNSFSHIDDIFLSGSHTINSEQFKKLYRVFLDDDQSQPKLDLYKMWKDSVKMPDFGFAKILEPTQQSILTMGVPAERLGTESNNFFDSVLTMDKLKKVKEMLNYE